MFHFIYAFSLDKFRCFPVSCNLFLPKTFRKGAFLSQMRKIFKLFTIKTTEAITTEFCTLNKYQNTFCRSSQNLTHKSKMADGLHLKKIHKLLFQQR